VSTSAARPDGRAETVELLALRKATRQLRLHLDTLPIEYNLAVTADEFLAGKAFMLARQRYASAESMIGAGFGGTVIGAIARSLFDEGLRWLWIGDAPERRRNLLGSLVEERNRVCVLFEESDVSDVSLPRWLMPIPNVADLAGQSRSWVGEQLLPSDEDLLRDFQTGQFAVRHHSPARVLFDMAGLQGAVMILTHAGHGNLLGLQSSLTADGGPAHDLRNDHEALFMQVAAAGVVSTLLGSAAVVPRVWPAEVDREAFLDQAVSLAETVCDAAVKIHGLDRVRKSPAQVGKRRPSQQKPVLLRPMAAVIDDDALLPDVNSGSGVAEAAEAYYDTVRGMPFNPWAGGSSSLHSALMFSGGGSMLTTVLSTFDQPGSEVIAVCAARMLLEESARVAWRYAVPPGQFELRAKQYFDEFRSRRRRTIETLAGSGVPRATAERLLALPDNVRIDSSLDNIAKNRERLPSISRMLRDLGAPFPEPDWLDVAYTLLSQVTHNTPLGYLHMITARPVWGTGISAEMLALALDTACLSSAHLIGLGGVLLTDLSKEAFEYQGSVE
jgi:NAD(P)-dependent dehydrogenase (short-subunit alcohol dehydrogenase family)